MRRRRLLSEPRAALELCGVRVVAGERTLLHPTDLRVREGEVLGVVGPSGAGKSTLLRAILDLHRPGVEGYGQLRLGARQLDLSARADRHALHRLRGGILGWLPQAAASSLDPLRTVGRQLAELGHLHGASSSPEAALARVGLGEEVARLRPSAISGGMARRVALALALVGAPAILLADEPLAGLDPIAAAGMVELLLDHPGDRTTILVAHDLAAVLGCCDRIVVLQDGRIVDDQAPQQLLDSRVPTSRALVEAAREGHARGVSWWR